MYVISKFSMPLSKKQKMMLVVVVAVIAAVIGFVVLQQTKRNSGCPAGTGIDAWHTLTSTHAAVDKQIGVCNGQFYYNNKPTCIAAGLWSDTCPSHLSCTPAISDARGLDWNTGQFHNKDQPIIGYTGRGLAAVLLAQNDPDGVIVECPSNVA